jgi:hypothetical protein
LATALDETGIEEQAPELRATLDFHEIIDPDNENLAKLLNANLRGCRCRHCVDRMSAIRRGITMNLYDVAECCVV